jgi:hypothetical protein
VQIFGRIENNNHNIVKKKSFFNLEGGPFVDKEREEG